ncbi:MAG: hypothetical protein U1E42_02005 [Rhodospirillales bacterium]
MTMKKALLAPFAGALMLMSVGSVVQAQDVPCASAIASYLKEVGVDLSKMTGVTVEAQRWAHKGDEGGPVYGYSFSGTPAQCSSGGIQMGLTTGCEVSHAATTPGCTIKGIAPVWW